jgi:hypothetical protein
MIKYILLSLLLLVVETDILVSNAYGGVLVTPSIVTIRPHVNYGYISVGSDSRDIFSFGGRILLPASDIRSYGVDITRFNTSSNNSFTSVGIVLEQRLWKFFNMSIGTVGYIHYRGNSPFGFLTNLGWEPKTNFALKPFITYRNDIIFADKTSIIYSLSLGLNLEL